MYRMAVPMCEAIRFLLFGFGDCLVGPGAPPSGLVREFAKGSDAIPSVQFGNLPEVLAAPSGSVREFGKVSDAIPSGLVREFARGSGATPSGTVREFAKLGLAAPLLRTRD